MSNDLSSRGAAGNHKVLSGRSGATVTVTPSDNQKWEGLTNKDGSIFWDKKPNGDRFIQEKLDLPTVM